jgi:hypothetical protein
VIINHRDELGKSRQALYYFRTPCVRRKNELQTLDQDSLKRRLFGRGSGVAYKILQSGFRVVAAALLKI